VQTRIDFSEEAQLRERLIESYKEELNETKDKLQIASTTIDEMKNMVLEINQEYKLVSDEKEQEGKAFEAKLKEKETVVNKLEQELKNANELLSIAKRKGATVLSESDIEQLSPAAAVASRLLKSGMSLTQIYSEHVNLSETLQQEKKENERLKSYIDELVRDIEEKAPTMIRQKQEYEDSVKTINNLTEQLEKSMMDFEVLKSKSEDSIKKFNLVTSENMRLKQDIQDFSRQITVLLHEIETMRRLASKSGNSVNVVSTKVDMDSSLMNTSIANLFASNAHDDSSMSEVTSSSEVQNKNLFLFRNIEELQKQNHKLVQHVHEITDKKQSEEKIELDLRTKEYNEKLNLAMRELEEFKKQREKQEQVVGFEFYDFLK
jgi:nucleoprotein TPR